MHDEVALLDLQAFDAVEGHRDPARVGARRELEVVFERAVVAVECGIDAGIETVVPDRIPGRYAEHPHLRIIAHVVVDASGERLGADGS